MRIAIIGADGQLGTDLLISLRNYDIHPFYFPEFDIIQKEKAYGILAGLAPDIVINTAAYNRVDEGEEDPAKVFALNALAVRNLAISCDKIRCALVHFSTDYVFDGKKKTPYVEADCPNPLNVYGMSKLTGEYFIRSFLDRYYIVRTSSLYGTTGCWDKGHNFVDMVISMEKNRSPLKIVNDQLMTPTSTYELAERIKELIKTERFGLYHLTNEGQCSWYECAKSIFEMMKIQPDMVSINSSEYGSKARRPAYSVLENMKAKKIGITEFSYWKDALRNYMIKKGYIK